MLLKDMYRIEFRDLRGYKIYSLSIIIPIYNVESYINQAIDSILNELRSNEVEIILVNDGFEDNSMKICEKYYKYENIICINKENGGLSDARNKGIDKANGQYILFLDGDDFLKKDSLNKILKIIRVNSCVDVILGNGISLYYSEYDIVELKWRLQENRTNQMSSEESYSICYV